MRDYIYIGESPADESCVQLGSDDYYERARKECAAFIRQLRRQFGDEPIGAHIRIKREAHDFGEYLTVVCDYEDTNEEATNYAFNLENIPEHWDEEAKKELEK